jgi:hypothetical protein
VYVDADEEEQDMVAVPFVVKLVVEIEPQFRPDGTLSVSSTCVVRPFRSATVIVDVAEEATFAGDGWVEANVKAGVAPKENVAVAVCVSCPLVAVRLTV